MHKIIFCSWKKKCVPTLPKIFRPVTRNTLIFFIWPYAKNKWVWTGNTTISDNKPTHSTMMKIWAAILSWHVHPSKTQISMRIRAFWSVSDEHSIGSQWSNISSGRKLRFCSDCADAQTNWNLHCMHMPTCTLCCIPTKILFLFDLILYVPSTIFLLNRDGSSWVEPVLSLNMSCPRTTTQWHWWGSNPQPLGLESSTPTQMINETCTWKKIMCIRP